MVVAAVAGFALAVVAVAVVADVAAVVVDIAAVFVETEWSYESPNHLLVKPGDLAFV